MAYSKVKTVITGETITAADRNAEHDNHITNHVQTTIDDYSVNIAQMQTVTDPYPAAAESLATSGAGELERLRFVIKQITGEAQWYIDPTNTLLSITSAGAVSGAALTLLGNTPVGAGDLPDANLSANVPLLNAGNTFTGNLILSKANPALIVNTTSGPSNLIFRASGADKAYVRFDEVNNEVDFYDPVGATVRFTFGIQGGNAGIMTAGTVPIARTATSKLDSSTAVAANTATSITIQAVSNSHRFYTVSVRDSAATIVYTGADVNPSEGVDASFHTVFGRTSTGVGDFINLVNGTGLSETAVYKVMELTQ